MTDQPATRPSYYAAPDGSAFRMDDHGGTSLEVTPWRATEGGFVLSLDSFDAPELSLRLSHEQANGLGAFVMQPLMREQVALSWQIAEDLAAEERIAAVLAEHLR